jgi:hypothetical protein
VIELPAFDSGQYEGCEFRISDGSAALSIRVAEQEPFTIYFSHVRWCEFTALPNCSADQIRSAYFKLVDLGSTDWRSAFSSADTSARKPYASLRHFRIFLEETGCYELLAESAWIGA